MATSTWRIEEFIGRLFKIKSDKAVIEENGWTLNCFQKNFPSGHSWCVLYAKRDSKQRWWVLMGSVSTHFNSNMI